MANKTHQKLTRVLLALDCGAIDADALRALKLLAGERDLEVTGLYVEDEDLLNAAQLPGVAEVSNRGSVATLDPEKVRRQIADEARSAREEFESSAQRTKLNYSFEITRGRPADKVVEAASTSDFVVINRSLRAAGLRTRRATHFAPLIQRHNNLLFVNEPWTSGQRIIVLSDARTESSARAIATAERFAAAEDIELVVAVPTHSTELQQNPGRRIVTLPSWGEDAIVDLCAAEDARLLVLPAIRDLDWQSLLLSLIDRVHCSLLRLD